MDKSTFAFSCSRAISAAPNRIVSEKPDFYISYNNKDRSIYGSDTTAIVTANMNLFLILNGNHSKQLAGKTFPECLEYFWANIAHVNKFSDHNIIRDIP